MKSEDIKIKYDLAEKYYENQEFRKASRLFEQIKPKYRGKPQGERITFFYANCLLNIKSYVLASYEFESFVKAYPLSQKVEDAKYLSAFAYYKTSPSHSLDQGETIEAIDKLQDFINTYPNSERMSSANDLVKELREKIEFKAFEIAKQYNTIRDYKSAIIVLDDFISDYPGTPYREDALFYLLDSSYELAINSVESKKKERLENAKKVYLELIETYPETKYIEQSIKLNDVLEKEITTFAKIKNMDFKKTSAPLNTITYDRNKLDSQTNNIYEAISVISKRTVQINEEIKKELIEKLEEFASPTESLDEIFENKEQIEVSKFYEKLPKAHAIAIENWLSEKFTFGILK